MLRRASLAANAQTVVHPDVFTKVWLVDKSDDFEIYSNGLRIDDHYEVSNQDRRVLSGLPAVGHRSGPAGSGVSEPAGIVYHTTESDQARFEPDQNGRLKRIGKDVLNFVRRNRCYHFVIDRFGQVFRVVQ